MTQAQTCLRIGEESEPETWEPMETPVPSEVPDVPVKPVEPVTVPERTSSPR